MIGDAGRYNWIWEGKFLTISNAAILAKKLSILRFDVDESYGTPYIGIDWGFSVDPTAAIEVMCLMSVYILETLLKSWFRAR